MRERALIHLNSRCSKTRGFRYLAAVSLLLLVITPITSAHGKIISRPSEGAGVSSTTFLQTLPTLSVADATVAEGDTGTTPAEFKLSLSAPSSQSVSFIATAQADTANASDFGPGSIPLTFLPGQTTIILTVFVIGDTAVEGTERFFLNLSSPVNATIADAQGIGTIVDDDALILLTEENVQRAIALDSVFFTRDSFSVANSVNFSSDQRTRVALFAVGLKLAQGETASAVTATAEDSQGTVRPLQVEFVGTVPNFNWLSQVVVKLNDQITLAGDIKVQITLHSATSNTVLVGLNSP
jgi:hypothetical protein